MIEAGCNECKKSKFSHPLDISICGLNMFLCMEILKNEIKATSCRLETEGLDTNLNQQNNFGNDKTLQAAAQTSASCLQLCKTNS